jgi:uncharacterized protein
MKQKLILVAMLSLFGCGTPDLPEKYGQTDPRLYLGDGDNQPLVVGLGGSEGGNAWDSDRWKPTRDRFLAEGYAFVALEYFGGPNTPEKVDRISLDAVHEAIVAVAKNPKIDASRICLVGGSKGAELALMMASNYSDITCVVGIVPCHAAFPALTVSAETSSWTYKGKEVPFVPMTWAAAPAVISRDLRKAFTIMLEDTVAVQAALIPVERINGPVLLVSASKDEMWPSMEMSNEVMARLKANQFAHPYEHLVIEGGHTAPLDHFDEILDFVRREFPARQQTKP